MAAIDGKTCRGSYDVRKNLGPLHIVSAWASEEGIALGQIATADKSNEITAIPQLLEQIEVQDTIVAIDAMGCQKDIVEKIVEAGAERYIGAMRACRRWHRGLRGAFLIQDVGSSHTAADTATCWWDCRGWWRPGFTPVYASWLDQAELLIGAFGNRYLKRASYRSRDQFLDPPSRFHIT